MAVGIQYIMAKKKTNLFLVATLTCLLGFAAGYLIFAHHEKPRPPEKAQVPATRHVPRAAIKEAPAVPESPVPPPAPMPMVAIIIDDMGSDIDALDKVIAIDARMDIAVLPMLRRSKETATQAEKAGLEVLLHLPMQPKGGSLKGLGPGALLLGMDEKTIKDTVKNGLDSVPGAVGVNNHMGSALTEEKDAMRTVMGVLKGRGLFFVDSRTTAGSVATLAAKEEGVRSASRRVFLDDSSDPAYIKAQFDRLLAQAKKDGTAIAIGHPHPNTLEVLKQEVPTLKEKGVELVRVSKLVK
jgi:polysaccharide deacetylase 2 family uncharacterized protein YibQ